MNCAKLSAENIAMASCKVTNPALLGEVVLINFDDWQEATKTWGHGSSPVIDPEMLTGITLVAGDYGTHITSHDKAFEASYSMNKGTYANSFVHTLVLRAFDRTQEIKDTLNKIIGGRFVAIVHNVDQSDVRTAFEVYGIENGLMASAIEGNSTDGDGMIAQITLASDDNQRESKVPQSFAVYSSNAYSYTATKSAFVGLYTRPTV